MTPSPAALVLILAAAVVLAAGVLGLRSDDIDRRVADRRLHDPAVRGMLGAAAAIMARPR